MGTLKVETKDDESEKTILECRYWSRLHQPSLDHFSGDSEECWRHLDFSLKQIVWVSYDKMLRTSSRMYRPVDFEARIAAFTSGPRPAPRTIRTISSFSTRKESVERANAIASSYLQLNQENQREIVLPLILDRVLLKGFVRLTS